MELTDQFKQMIQTAFDTVAQGYDHPSLAFFPDTSNAMMSHLDLDEDLQLLDICTGTGMIALNAAKRMPHGQVTGIDLSSGMLERAKEKAQLAGLNNTRFVQMDLDHLDLPEASFDLATSSFGLFFLSDMESALKNIVKTVKPGGRIAISCFTGNAFDPFATLFMERYASFGMEVPDLSWKRLATEELITDLYNSAGITEISFYHEPLSYPVDHVDNWWDVVWNAGFRGLLNQLTEEQQILFREQHLAEVAELIENDKVPMETNVIIAVGYKS